MSGKHFPHIEFQPSACHTNQDSPFPSQQRFSVFRCLSEPASAAATVIESARLNHQLFRQHCLPHSDVWSEQQPNSLTSSACFDAMSWSHVAVLQTTTEAQNQCRIQKYCFQVLMKHIHIVEFNSFVFVCFCLETFRFNIKASVYNQSSILL